MDQVLLDIQSITVNYGRGEVISYLSLQVKPGELTAIIGPNGAGKTTLLKAINGLVPIKTGKILIAGQDIHAIPDRQRARLLAVVPQIRQLPADVPVYQTVMLGRTPYINWLGGTSPDDHSIVRKAMEQVQISELGQRRIGELSGGERQRVLLARALAQQAPILLLDEPTTHLDLQHQSSLFRLLKSLVKDEDLTVLMVMHDVNLTGLYADRVVLLNQGKIVSAGTPAQVINGDNLSQIYGMPLHVISHPEYGTPLVLPDGLHPTRTPKSEI